MPLSYAPSKSFVILTTEGEPQLIHVYPIINEAGRIDTENLVVYLDEEGPHIMSYEALSSILRASDFRPLYEVGDFQVH